MSDLMTIQPSSESAFMCAEARSGKGKTLRRAASADQRARIVSAAEQLICERGAECVTVGDICEAAGVSRRTFYSSFESRGQCLLAVFDRASAQAGTVMAGAYSSADSWLDAIRGGLIELLCFLEDRPGLARFLVVASLTGDSALRTRRAERLAALARALEDACPTSAAGSMPASFGGEAVVGAVASILHGRLREEPVPSLREMFAALMSVIVLPYLDAAAARRELSRPAPPCSAVGGADRAQ